MPVHITDMYYGSGSAQSVAYHPSKEAHGELGDTDVDGDGESFVVLDPSGTPYFYNLRVTLQSFQGGKLTVLLVTAFVIFFHASLKTLSS